MPHVINKTQTQVTFNTNSFLKERTLEKTRQDGITLKALLTLAMREYLNNNLIVSLRPQDDYYDELFADTDVVKKANKLGEVLRDKRI